MEPQTIGDSPAKTDHDESSDGERPSEEEKADEETQDQGAGGDDKGYEGYKQLAEGMVNVFREKAIREAQRKSPPTPPSPREASSPDTPDASENFEDGLQSEGEKATDGKRKVETGEQPGKKRKVDSDDIDDGYDEKLGLQWVPGEEPEGLNDKSQDEDEDDDSDDSSWTTNSSSSSSDSSEEDETDKDEDKEEKKEVGPSMHINMQYPKTSLKRWSTTKTSTYIDTSAPSSYTFRQRCMLRKKQVTLPDMANKLAMSHATSSLH